MATLTSADIPDLVAGTLHNYGAPKFQNLIPTLQRHEIYGELMKRKKVIPGSIGLKRLLATETLGNAKMIGHHEVDTYAIGTHLVEMTVPWRYSTTHWGLRGARNRGEHGRRLAQGEVDGNLATARD